jgi:uncharacterized OB-fold protein
MATMAFNRALPEIKTDPTNQPFFDGARAGKLLIGKCNDTGKFFWYPRGCSPFTLSNNIELVEATNIVDCDLDSLKIGQKVKLVFKPTQGDGPPAFMFTPV